MSSKMRVGLLAVSGLLAGSLVRAPQASAAEAWTATGSLHTLRGDPSLALLQDGRVLAAGGWDYAQGAVSSAEIYNPATGVWLQTVSMHVARYRAVTVRLADGRVLVAGGLGSFDLKDAEVYVPWSLEWQLVPPMQLARSGASAVLLQDGRVLVTGGVLATTPSPGEIYDPISHTWSLTSVPATPRLMHTATLLPDGRVLVAGGRQPNGADVGAEIYDPLTDNWTATGPLATERHGHTAAQLPDGRVLIAGGARTDEGYFPDQPEIYDPAANTWTGSPISFGGNYTAAGLTLQDGRVMITGGYSMPFYPMKTVQLFDPLTGLSTYGPPLLETRYEHRAILLQDGSVLVVGGSNRLGCERLALSPQDSSPPVVTLTAPLGGTAVAGLVSVAADASDDTGVARVDFYDGASLIGSDTTAPYGVTWDTSKTAGGNHVLKARAFDGAGNFGDGATVAVTVQDVTLPQVAIMSPANEATVSGIVTITASASDASGIDHVEFNMDTYPIGSVAAAPYSVAWDTSTVSPGSHVLGAVAFDHAGNTAVAGYVTVTVGAPGGQTVYDSQLRAPRCAPGVAVCDSGDLLVGRGTVGPEPNQPNALAGSCGDGTGGSFHADESLDRIKVSTVDGSPLTPGKTVKVEVTVWAWSGYSSDKLDLFYAADATTPQWVYVGRFAPQGAGQQTLSATYVLPEGSLQAIRGRFSYSATSTAACVSGSYNDHDDLVFATQQEPGERAVYDANLRAPFCSNISSSCSSGTLLVGRGSVGPEPNEPNTSYGECQDGQEGTFHFEESIDKISVATLDGAPMAPGQTVRVDATVWVGSASDVVDLFYSSAATWPSWTHIGRLTPADTAQGPVGEQVFTATYTLPQDRAHVVRAVVRFGAPSTPVEPCGLGTKDDTDDLWFMSVAPPEGEKQRLMIDPIAFEGGSGAVTATTPGTVYTCSDPAGCDIPIPSGETVVLTARPAPDSIFVRWTSDCSGSGSCLLRMNQTHVASAEFLGPRSLTVMVSGVDDGRGSVALTPTPLGGSATPCANPAGETATCVYLYAPGTAVTLVSQAQTGSGFLGWGSACGGTNACQVLLASDPVTVDAAYQGPMPLTVTLTSQGGWGTVALNPPSVDGGITSCELLADATEQTCLVRYAPGTLVSLTAQPAAGSAFAQWGGACAGSGSCQVSPGTTVSAAFKVGAASPEAVYDTQLRAPKCAAGAAACDSGTLLVGRATLGPEPHYPNTVGASCSDGTGGTYHSDESVDRIRVATLDGSPLTPGKTVNAEVTIWAWSGYTSDKLDLYYAASATAPQWTFLGTLAPTKAGQQVLSTTYVLPSGSQQVLRARLRYGGSATSACVTGSYNDHDDLVF